MHLVRAPKIRPSNLSLRSDADFSPCDVILQLQQWKGEAPGLYDISGSAHFVNKTDNGIVVHRNRDPETGPLDEVKILVRKVRNKAAGTIGEASLRYDRWGAALLGYLVA